uniref:Uncharacterized protein n=2 Tax=Aegilops tauschii subsp. strangulata TaxID=200361 RepID=A0A453N614_AEGTS
PRARAPPPTRLCPCVKGLLGDASTPPWPWSFLPIQEVGVQKKKGRGVLKGFKASKKCFANGSAKLNITFSEKLGGIVGMNYRSFKDDVVVIMKRKLPLIGVRTWSGIHPTIHQLIVVDMIVRTTFSICVILFYHR